MKKKIAFIVNPVAGSKADKSKITGTINALLDKAIYSDIRTVYTEYRGHGTELAKQF